MSLSEDNSDGSKYFIIKIYAASCWAFSWSVCTPGNMRVAICYISHSHKASVSNPLSTSTPGFPYISQNQPLVSNEEVGCKWCHLQPNDSGATVWNYSQRRPVKWLKSVSPLYCCQCDSDWYSWSRGSRRGRGIVLKHSQISGLSLFAQWVVVSGLVLWTVQLSDSVDSSTKNSTISWFSKQCLIYRIYYYSFLFVFVGVIAAIAC